MGLVIRLTARWSCSTILLRYLTCRNLIGMSLSALMSSIAALLATLLFRVTVSGSSLCCIALSKNCLAVLIPLCRQQEINRLTRLVYGTIQIFPDTFGFDISFIHASAVAHGRFIVPSKTFFQLWCIKVWAIPNPLSSITSSSPR